MCDLCILEGGLKITICNTCGVPMIVSYDHRPEFSEKEKELIEKLFPDRNKRWEMRKIPTHAHVHIIG